MIGKVQVTVLAAVAPLQEAAVPAARQGQLHVIVDGGLDQATSKTSGRT